MSKQPIFVLALAAAILAGGCTLGGVKEPPPNPNAAKVSRSQPVTSTGRKAVVLSLHVKKEFPEACMLGMTLTNNLDTKVTNISVRLTAYINGNVQFDTITRNFSELKPTESQYREATFTQIQCNKIDFIGVTDPGRCAIGDEMNRFTTAPGDCAKFVDVAVSPQLTIRKMPQPKVREPEPTE